MEIRRLDQMFEVLATRKRKRLVAAWAIDAHSIVAVSEAVRRGIVEGILVGDEACIKKECKNHNIDPALFKIVHCEHDLAAAAKAVELINAGQETF